MSSVLRPRAPRLDRGAVVDAVVVVVVELVTPTPAPPLALSVLREPKLKLEVGERLELMRRPDMVGGWIGT